MVATISRVLRATPLARVKWVTRTHDWIFRRLWNSSKLKVNDFILNIDPRDCTIGKKLSLYGEYEDSFRSLIGFLAESGTVAIDAGANVGLHTVVMAAAVGREGQVFAFEPDPDNYRLLTSNLKANGLENVLAHQLALSSKSGSATLYQSSENRGGLSLVEANVERLDARLQPVAVRTVPADDILEKVTGKISLVKIDVEGAEPLVLAGMRKTLSRNPEAWVIFEFWPKFVQNFGIGPLEFLNELESDGFNLGVIVSGKTCVRRESIASILRLGESSRDALNIIATRRGPQELDRLDSQILASVR